MLWTVDLLAALKYFNGWFKVGLEELQSIFWMVGTI